MVRCCGLFSLPAFMDGVLYVFGFGVPVLIRQEARSQAGVVQM